MSLHPDFRQKARVHFTREGRLCFFAGAGKDRAKDSLLDQQKGVEKPLAPGALRKKVDTRKAGAERSLHGARKAMPGKALESTRAIRRLRAGPTTPRAAARTVPGHRPFVRRIEATQPIFVESKRPTPQAQRVDIARQPRPPMRPATTPETRDTPLGRDVQAAQQKGFVVRELVQGVYAGRENLATIINEDMQRMARTESLFPHRQRTMEDRRAVLNAFWKAAFGKDITGLSAVQEIVLRSAPGRAGGTRYMLTVDHNVPAGGIAISLRELGPVAVTSPETPAPSLTIDRRSDEPVEAGALRVATELAKAFQSGGEFAQAAAALRAFETELTPRTTDMRAKMITAFWQQAFPGASASKARTITLRQNGVPARYELRIDAAAGTARLLPTAESAETANDYDSMAARTRGDEFRFGIENGREGMSEILKTVQADMAKASPRARYRMIRGFWAGAFRTALPETGTAVSPLVVMRSGGKDVVSRVRADLSTQLLTLERLDSVSKAHALGLQLAQSIRTGRTATAEAMPALVKQVSALSAAGESAAVIQAFWKAAFGQDLKGRSTQTVTLQMPDSTPIRLTVTGDASAGVVESTVSTQEWNDAKTALASQLGERMRSLLYADGAPRERVMAALAEFQDVLRQSEADNPGKLRLLQVFWGKMFSGAVPRAGVKTGQEITLDAGPKHRIMALVVDMDPAAPSIQLMAPAEWQKIDMERYKAEQAKPKPDTRTHEQLVRAARDWGVNLRISTTKPGNKTVRVGENTVSMQSEDLVPSIVAEPLRLMQGKTSSQQKEIVAAFWEGAFGQKLPPSGSVMHDFTVEIHAVGSRRPPKNVPYRIIANMDGASPTLTVAPRSRLARPEAEDEAPGQPPNKESRPPELSSLLAGTGFVLLQHPQYGKEIVLGEPHAAHGIIADAAQESGRMNQLLRTFGTGYPKLRVVMTADLVQRVFLVDEKEQPLSLSRAPQTRTFLSALNSRIRGTHPTQSMLSALFAKGNNSLFMAAVRDCAGGQ